MSYALVGLRADTTTERVLVVVLGAGILLGMLARGLTTPTSLKRNVFRC
jgi:hypothetical protein